MKQKWIFFIIIMVLALAIGLVYANANRQEKKQSSNFKIVTTFYPVYIMTQNLTQGAQNIELVNMAETNVGCLHDYTLTTTDMKKIEDADVIVQNGLGLENFIDKILNTYSNIKVINSSKAITNQIEENGEINSHTWTSITNYIGQVEEIAKNLGQINPENAAIYANNKDRYVQELQNLQEKYRTELENIKGKKAICLNEAIPYLAKEVGLQIISVQTDHEESSLSAEKIKKLIQQMKAEKISAILVDEEDNLKSAQTLQNETGAKIYQLKSGLTGNMDKNAYIQMMTENLEILKQL